MHCAPRPDSQCIAARYTVLRSSIHRTCRPLPTFLRHPHKKKGRGAAPQQLPAPQNRRHLRGAGHHCPRNSGTTVRVAADRTSWHGHRRTEPNCDRPAASPTIPPTVHASPRVIHIAEASRPTSKPKSIVAIVKTRMHKWFAISIKYAITLHRLWLPWPADHGCERASSIRGRDVDGRPSSRRATAAQPLTIALDLPIAAHCLPHQPMILPLPQTVRRGPHRAEGAVGFGRGSGGEGRRPPPLDGYRRKAAHYAPRRRGHGMPCPYTHRDRVERISS